MLLGVNLVEYYKKPYKRNCLVFLGWVNNNTGLYYLLYIKMKTNATLLLN